MSFIRKTPSKAWRVFWYTGQRNPVTGRPIEDFSKELFDNRAAAEEWKRNFDLTHKKNRRRSTGTATIDEALAKLKEAGGAKGCAKERYLNEVEERIKAMAVEKGWERVTDITADDVKDWRDDRDGVGCRKPMLQLRAFLRFCMTPEMKIAVDEDVLLLRLPPPGRRRDRLMTPEEVVLALTQAYRLHFPSGVACEIISKFGRRGSDISRADVRHWNKEKRLLHHFDTKNNEHLVDPVPEPLASKLDNLVEGRNPDEPLFMDPWSRRWPVTKQGASFINSWYRQNVGEHVLPRDVVNINALKKFAATNSLIAAKGDVKAGMSVTGHSSIASYERYLVDNVDSKKAVVANIPVLPEISAITSPEVAALLPKCHPSDTMIRRRRQARKSA